MFPSASSRRFVLLIRRTTVAATAGGGSNSLKLQPHLHASLYSRDYSPTPVAGSPDPETCPTASCGCFPAAASQVSLRLRSTAKASAVVDLLRRHGFFDAASSKVSLRLRSTAKASASAVVSLLRRHGFFDPATARLLLVSQQLPLLRPKLDSVGFRATSVVHTPLISHSPGELVVPCANFLRGILHPDANIPSAVEALRSHGLTEKAVSRFLAIRTKILTANPNLVEGIIKDVDALGLSITDSSFIDGLWVLSRPGRKAMWHQAALFQGFGLSKAEVLKAFRSAPNIMLHGDEIIQKKLRFFRDELKVTLADVIAQPYILKLSLELNILPKCSVLSVLMREGKIRRHMNFLHTMQKGSRTRKVKLLDALELGTKTFVQRFVSRYQKDVPDVVEAYEGRLNSKDSCILIPVSRQSQGASLPGQNQSR